MQPVIDWLLAHRTMLRWAVVASLVAALVTLIVLPILVARMRPDYFVERERPADAWSARHPVLRVMVRVIKNVIGAALLISGIWLLVLPGQGVLTILVGLTLLDFPGKRAMELGIVSKPGVLRALNWIRRKANRDPLVIPDG